MFFRLRHCSVHNFDLGLSMLVYFRLGKSVSSLRRLFRDIPNQWHANRWGLVQLS